MSKPIAIFAAVAVLTLASTAYALYSVADTGTWPKSWPSELEPLRKQTRTLVGPTMANQHFAMRFTDREEFESAWPHLLKVKSKGAPIFLVRGSNFFLGKGHTGAVIHCPPKGQWENANTPEGPIKHATHPRTRWGNTNYIELMVDGKIVDLNRIPLPADTPVIDERFEKSAEQSGKLKSR